MLRDYLGRMDGFEGAAGWISTDCANLRYFKGMLEPFRGQLTHTLRSNQHELGEGGSVRDWASPHRESRPWRMEQTMCAGHARDICERFGS